MASTSSPDDIKQVIILRTDLGMGKGKLAGQASHASVDAYLDCVKKDSQLAKQWHENGMPKSVVKVESEKELVNAFQKAKDLGLACSLIRDAGKTQIEPGTKTAVGIGPARAEEIDKISGLMKLL